jgi:exocyst complex protein 7
MMFQRTQDKRGEVDDDLHILEQDVYAAADALELLKNTFSYFTGHEEDETLLRKSSFTIDPFDDRDISLDRRRWKSTGSTLRNIEQTHQRGVEGMCFLIKAHLLKAGPAIRMKRPLVARGDVTISTVPAPKGEGLGKDKNGSTSMMQVPYESAAEARIRFNTAVQNRDLMKSIGEFEEYLPLTTRMVRELRAIFECLGEKKTFWGCALGDNVMEEMNVIITMNMKKKLVMNEVTRTEPVGSGRYCNICMVCHGLYHVFVYF